MKVLQTVNLGSSLGGISGSIRYELFNTLGTTVVTSRNTGIYELGTSTGIYGVELNLSTQFSGSILWEVTASNGNIVFANEEVETDQKVTRHFTNGRWLIDENTHEMIFYQEDNTTEMGRFDLKDKDGSAAFQDVFERIRK